MPPVPRARSSRARRWLVAAAAVVVLVVLGSLGWTRMRTSRVRAVLPRRGELAEKVVTTGRVLPPARIQLGSTIMARALEVRVDEGDRVKKGDPLVLLDDAEQAAALVQAHAAVTRAQVGLGRVRDVSSSIAELKREEARSSLDLAERQWQRLTSLVDAGAVTDEQQDQAREALETARSRLAMLEVESKSLGPGGSEQAAAGAQVAEAVAEKKEAEARLGQTRLLAPADGIVLTRSVEPGDVVRAGQTLLVIARSGATRLSVQADEKDLAVLELGQIGKAVADALPDQPFSARTSFFAPEVDADRGTIEVRLDVPEPPEGLRPDMTVSVNIEVARRKDALLLPESAVREANSKKPWVLVAVAGRAEKREIALGTRGDGLVEVKKGASPKEPVILPSEGVEAGGRVKVEVVELRDAL